MKNNCAVMAIEIACDEMAGLTKVELANRNELSQAGVGRVKNRGDYEAIQDAVLAVFVDEIARARAREYAQAAFTQEEGE